VRSVASAGLAPGAPAWVRSNFSADRMVGEVASLYDELLVATGAS
jgi:hypothetical protein